MLRGWRRPFGLAITGLALAFFASTAYADNLADCRNNALHGDARIKPCSAIIDAGTGTVENIATAYYRRASVYHIRGAFADYEGNRDQAIMNYDRAIKDLDRAITLRPKFADAYEHRGLTHEGRGNTKKAIADYRKALELQPGHVSATEGLARLAP